MKVLIIGLGSIAKKHISALREINPTVQVAALRSSTTSPKEPDVENIFSISDVNSTFDFCIISNPTQLHYSTIKDALQLNIPLFIEKPSLMSLDGTDEILEIINQNKIVTYVAFNLRTRSN